MVGGARWYGQPFLEPTPADMIAMQEADVLIHNGGEMEISGEKVLGLPWTPSHEGLTMMDYGWWVRRACAAMEEGRI